MTEVDLCNLFNGRDYIRNIIIRTSQGCGIVPIPGKDMVSRDRCYAPPEVIGLKRSEEILKCCDPMNPSVLFGLPVTLGLSPFDMPEVDEILKMAEEEKTDKILRAREKKTKYVNVIC